MACLPAAAMAADESGPTGPGDRERETDDSRVGVPGCSALPTGLVAAAAGDDNSRRRSILHRSQATSALKAAARDRTVHLKTNASGPLSASPDDTPIANATTSSTPKKVVIALKILSKSARLIFLRLSDAVRPELLNASQLGFYREGRQCVATASVRRSPRRRRTAATRVSRRSRLASRRAPGPAKTLHRACARFPERATDVERGPRQTPPAMCAVRLARSVSFWPMSTIVAGTPKARDIRNGRSSVRYPQVTQTNPGSPASVTATYV